MSRITEFALPTLIFVVSAKILTVRETAELSMFLAAAAILNVLFGFGQDAFILRFGSDLPAAAVQSRFYQRIVTSVVATTTVGFITFVIANAGWLSDNVTLATLGIGVLFVVSLSVVGFSTHLLLSRSQPRSTIGPTLIGRSVQVALLISSFLAGYFTFFMVALSFMLASLVQAFMLLRKANLTIVARTGPNRLNFTFESYAKHVWTSDLANLLLGRQIDLLLLLLIVGSASSIATYNLGSQLISSIEAGLSFGILSTFIPHFKEFISDHELRAEHRTALSLYSLWAAPIIGLSIVITAPLVHLLFLVKYPQLELLLTIGLSILLLRVGLFGGNLSYTILLTRQHAKQSMQIRVVCAVASIPLNALLIWLYGSIGAIIGSQALALIACAWETIHAIKHGWISPALYTISCVGVAFILTIAGRLLLDGSLISTVAIAMGYIGLYFTFTKLLNRTSPI